MAPLVRPSALVAGLVCLLALPGCGGVFGKSDAHAPGAPLGTYHVAATRSQNTCGEGALGTSAAWAFDVKLARAEGTLYWNNGQELITGTLGGDGESFAFDTGVQIDMRGAGYAGGLPCSVRRSDQAAGALDAKTDDVMAFTGQLTYAYTPTAGSRCDDLVNGMRPVFAALPCQMQFALAATRTQAP